MAQKKERISKIVGVGVDGRDGHIRFTTGEGYELLNGSEESHDLMQQWCEAINRQLSTMDKDITQLSVEEFLAVAREAAPEQ